MSLSGGDAWYNVTVKNDTQYFKESDYYYSKLTEGVDFRAKNLESFDSLEKTSIDFYATVRSLYLQDRDRKIENLKVSEDLTQFEFLTKAMIVKLAENNIKTLDDFAGLTTDDLIGYLEVKGDKNSKVSGLLEEFNITREEGDQLIMEARKIWLD